MKLLKGKQTTKGAVYKVKADAAEPFNTVPGEEFTLINVTPVLNAPFVANTESLSEEDFKKIQELFTSDELQITKRFLFRKILNFWAIQKNSG